MQVQPLLKQGYKRPGRGGFSTAPMADIGSLHVLSNVRYVIGTCGVLYPTCSTQSHSPAASTTLFMWDYVLTVNDEIHIIWQRGLSRILRARFLWLRYVPMACLLYCAHRTFLSFPKL